MFVLKKDIRQDLHMFNATHTSEAMGDRVSPRKKHFRARTGTHQSNSVLMWPNRMLHMQKTTSKGGFLFPSYGTLMDSAMKRNLFADDVKRVSGSALILRES
jgi:hypothetical protein